MQLVSKLFRTQNPVVNHFHQYLPAVTNAFTFPNCRPRSGLMDYCGFSSRPARPLLFPSGHCLKGALSRTVPAPLDLFASLSQLLLSLRALEPWFLRQRILMTSPVSPSCPAPCGAASLAAWPHRTEVARQGCTSRPPAPLPSTLSPGFLSARSAFLQQLPGEGENTPAQSSGTREPAVSGEQAGPSQVAEHRSQSHAPVTCQHHPGGPPSQSPTLPDPR